MKLNGRRLILTVLLGFLLSGCGARFPTGKFMHPDTAGNRFLIFYPDGRWEGFLDGNLLTFGNYTTDGDRITFESDFQCRETGLPETAAYVWKYDGGILTFQPDAEDLCSARVSLLAGEFQRSQ